MYINHVFKSIPKVKVYNSIPELIDALGTKKVDVIFVTKYTSDYWTNANQGDYKLIGDSFDIGGGYGIMTLTQNQSIMVSMNAVIRAMMDDGFYSKIFQRYFGAFR
jgi:ABC-type amino acid transport substrate-binding protein